nr:unnamed protein product [Naegleria fowleri]
MDVTTVNTASTQNNPSSSSTSVKNSFNSTPSSSPQVGHGISQQEQNSPLVVIDYYFTFLCQGHPLVLKSQMRHFVQTVLPELEKSLQRKPLKFEQIHPKDEENRCLYAFYLAMLTCYYQFTAQLLRADETARKTEREIAKLSIDYYRNFYFAGTCHQMSIYYTGEGNMQRARYFLALTGYYVNENKKRELSPLERNLKKHRVFISSDVDSASMDTIGSFGFFLEKMPSLFELSSDKKLEDALPPGTLEYVKEENVTADNYLIYMQIIELVFNAIKSYKVELIRTVVDCHSEIFFKSQHLHGALMVEGIKFVFLSKIPEIAKNLMEEIALKISLMTEHELFQYANLGVSGGIMNVSAYHLEICKLIERGLRPRKSTLITTSQKTLILDYISILKKDYKALSLLTRKYRRLSSKCQSLLDEMEQFLSRHDPSGSSEESQSTNSSSSTATNSSTTNSSSMATAAIMNAFATPSSSSTSTNQILSSTVNHSSNCDTNPSLSSCYANQYSYYAHPSTPPPAYMEPTTITTHSMGVPTQNHVVLTALLQYVENIAKSMREQAQEATDTPIVIHSGAESSSRGVASNPRSDDGGQMDSFSDFLF